MHFTEILPQASSPIISTFRLKVNNFLVDPASFLAKKRQQSRALTSRSRLFLLFWLTATVTLHSRTRFSAVPHIIPASQVLPKNATAGFGQGFPERASAAQPLPPSEISQDLCEKSPDKNTLGSKFHDYTTVWAVI